MANTSQGNQYKLAALIINEMFQVQPGEEIAITGDSGSNRDFADALADATIKAGGKFLILWTPKASQDGQAGINDWPSKSLSAALCNVDVWIELQSTILLYSDVWEKAMQTNKKLRYLIIGDSSIPSMIRTFMGFDIPKLHNLLNEVLSMSIKTKTIRITSENGTDVSYDTDSNYFFDMDSGDYSKPKFGTAPGYVNIVPKIGSMNGVIVFDLLMNSNVFETDERVEFMMEEGKIVKVNGTSEAEKFKDYLADFHDENMYMISHNMLGFNPGVRTLRGEIVEDERVWGGVDFGFGHTSLIDMPPLGQPAKSHFDGVVEKTTIYFDGVKIVQNGEVCHPSLVDLANQLLNKSSK
ncbi:hypothetical protein OAF23_03830 [Flavobacteriaceae bacterium]|nr:hypothetical protein [Flavobacteriaceae bacterium]